MAYWKSDVWVELLNPTMQYSEQTSLLHYFYYWFVLLSQTKYFVGKGRADEKLDHFES